MALSELFEKPIDRPIDGVIKADDEAGLLNEVEEYVLTNEISKRLDLFLSAYLNSTSANGAWISGFFGSGKSHLLKMLALLLEDREVEGQSVQALFIEKCAQDALLKGNIKKAASIPSRSILFNIDQKADVITKQQVDALLAVFAKVFDEMCGYYGKQSYVAQFERDLDSRDQFAPFKTAYEEIAGRPWERGREQVLLENANIAAALSRVTGEAEADTRGIINRYRDTHKLSIEDFAHQVKAYIDAQEADFRLNFFVDEVGQYIADHVKLMTNLQTLAESLATVCEGRAWIIVTAQEDMNTVIGEFGKQQSNDFSKIQARFKHRMKLTSADVEEVIRRRLLQKNAQGIQALKTVYELQHNNFRTLFGFSDGTQNYRGFKDVDHFTHTYPFIPYQFTLFQQSLEQLSVHNAFEGKHSSVGERSMLEVFQDVARQISDHQLGELATFDLMFEGIRSTLKSLITSAIPKAEQNLGNPFAVRLLKALFLVKYIREFQATPRNLAVLMLEKFDADPTALLDKIQAGLDLLEQQTYVQRNGEVFEFLTNEEKDVEEEIKSTNIEQSEVLKELGDIVFDDIIKSRKFEHPDYKYPYAFGRKLDDMAMGRVEELTIQVISPFHEHNDDLNILRSQSMGTNTLYVVMPANDRLVRDLQLYKRTQKYVQQTQSPSLQDSTRRILDAKYALNNERYAHLKKLVAALLSEATLLANGTDLEITTTDPQARIAQAFHALLAQVYPHLKMLRAVNYTEEDIRRHLNPDPALFTGEGAVLSEAEQEMLNFIQREHNGGMRATVKSVSDQFIRRPYGWYPAAVMSVIAKLLARNKVEARRDGTLLENPAEQEDALRRTPAHASVLLQPQEDFTPAQVRGLKDFYGHFFDRPPESNEAKLLGREAREAFGRLREDLEAMRRQQDRYPFLKDLAQPIEALNELQKKPYGYFLTDLRSREDELYDLKETIIDPMRMFMNGAQRTVYDEAVVLLEENKGNLSFTPGEERHRLSAILRDPQCYRGNHTQELKRLTDHVRQTLSDLVEKQRRSILKTLDLQWHKLIETDDFNNLDKPKQDELQQPFERLKKSLGQNTSVNELQAAYRYFDMSIYPALLGKMAGWLASDGDHDTSQPVEFIPLESLKVSDDKLWLASEIDVVQYLERLREALLKAIEDGKRIQL